MGRLWAATGQRPRCVRIFPVCRLPVRVRTQTGARHRQVDDFGLIDEREDPHASAKREHARGSTS